VIGDFVSGDLTTADPSTRYAGVRDDSALSPGEFQDALIPRSSPDEQIARPSGLESAHPAHIP
jgi:hypothetical protein